jgi:tetratricopeptide (TPR) repeat protein
MQVVNSSRAQTDKAQVEQAMARRDLGLDHLKKGKNALALRELKFADELNPNDPETLLWLGEGYRRQRHNDTALDYMERAVAIDPDFHRARLNLAAFYLQIERYEDAITHSQVLIDDALYGAPWYAFSNRGWAEYKLGRYEEAQESFEMALEFRRNFWPARLNLGIVAEAAGRQREAIEHFARVLEADVGTSADAEANFRTARLYVSMGHRRKAIQHFNAVLEDDPEGDWGQQASGYLKMLR